MPLLNHLTVTSAPGSPGNLMHNHFFNTSTVCDYHSCTSEILERDLEPDRAKWRPEKEIKLNLLGRPYVLPTRILRRKDVRSTRLGRIAMLDHKAVLHQDLVDEYNSETAEYLIEQPPAHLEIILNLYTTGLVHRPAQMCSAEFRFMLCYWEVPLTEKFICPCAGLKLEKEEPVATKMELAIHKLTKYGRFKASMWDVVDNVESPFGRAFLSFSMVVLFANIVLMILDSYGEFAFSDKCSFFELPPAVDPACTNHSESMDVTAHFSDMIYEGQLTLMGQQRELSDVSGNATWSCPNVSMKRLSCISSIVVTLWFTLEFVLRAFACPSKVDFIKGGMNWSDFLAVAPFYIELVLKAAAMGKGSPAVQRLGATRLLRLLKILQVVRLLKFARASKDMIILLAAMKSAARSFMLLLVIMIFFVTAFATMMFYAERGQPNTAYTSIPEAAWYTIATYFTYNNDAPVSTLGKFISAAGSVLGIVVLAFPVGLILESFTTAYKMHTE